MNAQMHFNRETSEWTVSQNGETVAEHLSMTEAQRIYKSLIAKPVKASRKQGQVIDFRPTTGEPVYRIKKHSR